jgi:hypothetical protein
MKKLNDRCVYTVQESEICIGVFDATRNGFIGLKNCLHNSDLTFVSMRALMESQKTNPLHIKASFLGTLPSEIPLDEESELLYTYLVERV